MAKTYLLASDWLKKEDFPVLAPAYFNPALSSDNLLRKEEKEVFTSPLLPTRLYSRDRRPFEQPSDPDELVERFVTTETMISMNMKEVPFRLVREGDIVEILTGVDRYLVSLEADVKSGVEQTVEYVRYVLKFREEVYKNFYRYANLNEGFKRSLYMRNNPDLSIFALLSAITGNRDGDSWDPLLALRNPPYDLETTPKGKPEIYSTGSMEAYLGVSNNAPVTIDDGKDFIFEDFLKG